MLSATKPWRHIEFGQTRAIPEHLNNQSSDCVSILQYLHKYGIFCKKKKKSFTNLGVLLNWIAYFSKVEYQILVTHSNQNIVGLIKYLQRWENLISLIGRRMSTMSEKTGSPTQLKKYTKIPQRQLFSILNNTTKKFLQSSRKVQRWCISALGNKTCTSWSEDEVDGMKNKFLGVRKNGEGEGEKAKIYREEHDEIRIYEKFDHA